MRGDSHYINNVGAGAASIWHSTIDKTSRKKYWYNAAGQTSWTNPAAAAASGTGPTALRNAATSSTWVTFTKKKKKKSKRMVDVDPLM